MEKSRHLRHPLTHREDRSSVLSNVYSFAVIFILSIVGAAIVNHKNKALMYLCLTIVVVHSLGFLVQGFIWNSSVPIFAWYLKEITFNLVIIYLVFLKIDRFGRAGNLDNIIIYILVFSCVVNLIEYIARNIFSNHALMPYYFWAERASSILMILVLYSNKFFEWIGYNKEQKSKPE